MKLTIFNFTNYNTSDLRKIMRRCCTDLCIKKEKVVVLELDSKCSSTCGYYGHGRAFLGSRKAETPFVDLWLPSDYIEPVYFARLFKHELMHTQGVLHKDMTVEQYNCTIGCEWAAFYPVKKEI